MGIKLDNEAQMYVWYILYVAALWHIYCISIRLLDFIKNESLQLWGRLFLTASLSCWEKDDSLKIKQFEDENNKVIFTAEYLLCNTFEVQYSHEILMPLSVVCYVFYLSVFQGEKKRTSEASVWIPNTTLFLCKYSIGSWKQLTRCQLCHLSVVCPLWRCWIGTYHI